MSTDRLAGETPPEQEAAPGTADAQTPDDPTTAREDPTAPEAPAAPGNDATASGPDATAPENAPAPDAGTTAPEQAAAPDTGTTAADTDTTAPESPPARAADATGPVSGPEPTAPGAGDRAPDSGAARETAVPSSGKAPASAKATADALAAAVRAVETGQRTAASFFNDAPRPAPRAAQQATPAARPREDRPDTTGRAPQQGASPGPAPEAARPGNASGAGGPAGAPVTDTGAMSPAAAPAPAGPAPAPRPAVAAAPGIEGVRQVLTAGGAPQALAEPAAEVLGERAAEALSEDPWQLLGVPGVRPEQADGFARALLGPACGPGDERRAQALVGWLLEQAAVAGHSALEAAALRAALAQRSVPDPDEALQTAIADGAVLVFQDAIEEPGRARPTTGDDEDEEQPVRILLGLDRFAMAEESVADGLARLLNTFEAVAGPEQDAPAETGASGDVTAAAEPTATEPEAAEPAAAEPADADRSPAAGGGGAPRPTARGPRGAAPARGPPHDNPPPPPRRPPPETTPPPPP
ncbi:helix-hairpin-helix domain-containing protein, partial [Streptomyces lydicus]